MLAAARAATCHREGCSLWRWLIAACPSVPARPGSPPGPPPPRRFPPWDRSLQGEQADHGLLAESIRTNGFLSGLEPLGEVAEAIPAASSGRPGMRRPSLADVRRAGEPGSPEPTAACAAGTGADGGRVACAGSRLLMPGGLAEVFSRIAAPRAPTGRASRTEILETSIAKPLRSGRNHSPVARGVVLCLQDGF